MNRVVASLGVLSLLCMLAPAVWGDYSDPPDWGANPYYTHQSWEFHTDANPLAPDSTTHPVSNPNGTPEGEMLEVTGQFTATWIDDVSAIPGGTGRQGAWSFEALVPDGVYNGLKFTIPNLESDSLKKQVWFQATLWTDNPRAGDNDQEVYAKIFDDGDSEHPYVSRDIELLGDGWVHATYMFEIDPQPAFETLYLGAHLLQGERIVVDQVDVDTRCVPEPSSVVLLGMGAVALLAYTWRKRRRR